MLPESLQNIQRLLLICLNEREVIVQLTAVIQTIRQSVPTADLILFTSYKAEEIATQLPPIVLLSPLDCGLELGQQEGDFLQSNLFQNEAIAHLIKHLKSYGFDTALILTVPEQSPHAIAYLCYLAGIPTRIGQTLEFGGGVLSHPVQPALENLSLVEHFFYLLRSTGLSSQNSVPLQSTT